MKVACPACGAKYTVADDKVRGRRVKIRCKSCSSPILVEPGSAEAEAPAPAPAQQSAPAQQAANGSSEVWSVNLSDTDQRTMTTQEIVAGFRSGVVTDDAFVWKDGMGDWVPVLEMPELRALIESPNQAPAAAAPAAAVAAAPPVAAAATTTAASTTARRAGGRSQGTTDLFGGVATAGSESDVATSAALPGSTPYEAKPTGARNENSVLFSLDSLKVGFSAPTPSPARVGNRPEPPERRAPYSQPDDPFGMSAGNSGVAKLGGGGMNPLFGSENQALLFAPPPPPEPPPRPVVVANPLAGQFADVLAPPARKMPSKRVMVGGAVALLVLIGGIALALSGGEEPTADATEGIKAEVKNEAEKPRPKPEPEAKQEEPKPADTEKTSTTTEKKEPTEAEKKSAAAGPRKKVDAKATEEKKSEPTPAVASGDGPPFNKGAAVSALTSASSAASGCKRPGGPTGSGKVTVTFAPNGRVTQASVSGGSYGGTSVGGCVASVFRRSKIPAFSGNAVTVSKSFNISP